MNKKYIKIDKLKESLSKFILNSEWSGRIQSKSFNSPGVLKKVDNKDLRS